MKKRLVVSGLALLVAISTTLSFLSINTFAAPNYLEAMGKAIDFYDANRCGPSVTTNNIYSWRSSCHTTDGSEGYWDDGGFTMQAIGKFRTGCFSVCRLVIIEFGEYDAAGKINKTLSTLKYLLTFYPNLIKNLFLLSGHDGGIITLIRALRNSNRFSSIKKEILPADIVDLKQLLL